MEKDITAFARNVLIKHIVQPDDAVMFDIDDTLISSETLKPIKWVIDILNLSKALGYEVIIITARPGTAFNKMYTRTELDTLHIYSDLLLFSPPGDKLKMKNASRKRYVLSVGDQLTDLSGGLYFIKLPDKTDKNYYTGSSTSIYCCN